MCAWSTHVTRSHQRAQVVVYLDTGSGKTFVSVLLIRHVYAELAEQPQPRAPFLAVFMAPTVALVEQQFGVLKSQLDLRVARYQVHASLLAAHCCWLPPLGTLAHSTPTLGMQHDGRQSWLTPM